MSDDVDALMRLRKAVASGDYTPPLDISRDCVTVMETVQQAAAGADMMSSKGFPAGKILLEVVMEHVFDENGARTLVATAMVLMHDMTDENRTFIADEPWKLDPEGQIETAIRELRGKR